MISFFNVPFGREENGRKYFQIILSQNLTTSSFKKCLDFMIRHPFFRYFHKLFSSATWDMIM